MSVCEKVPYAQAVEATRKKPSDVTCIDVLKANGKRRSPLIAQEFNNGDDPDMYAPMPPLEGVKLLLTFVAMGVNWRQRSQKSEEVLMRTDIHRVYFNTKVDQGIFMQLPPESMIEGGSRRCGKH